MSETKPQKVGDPGWFQVTEVENGHTWGNVVVSSILGECCRDCGMMRRRDHKNKPCKGRPEITLR